LPVPAEDRVRGDDRDDTHQAPTSKDLSSGSETSTLRIGQTESASAELLFKDAVLLARVLDGGLMLAGEPAGRRGDEDLPGLNDRAHREIERASSENRKLSARPRNWVNWRRFEWIDLPEFTPTGSVN
jgi:hypothetical protein